jgi:CheY-like chemotaxis protein
METSSPPPSKNNVLCVEASDLILTWLVPAIERLGCNVIQATDFKSAQETINKNVPLDLVLLGDITRPTHPAAQLAQQTSPAELVLLKEIRKIQCYKDVPVVVFTSVDYLAEATAAGANDTLVKPAGIEELETVILHHLAATKAPAILNKSSRKKS